MGRRRIWFASLRRQEIWLADAQTGTGPFWAGLDWAQNAVMTDVDDENDRSRLHRDRDKALCEQESEQSDGAATIIAGE